MNIRWTLAAGSGSNQINDYLDPSEFARIYVRDFSAGTVNTKLNTKRSTGFNEFPLSFRSQKLCWNVRAEETTRFTNAEFLALPAIRAAARTAIMVTFRIILLLRRTYPRGR